jgi:hypothetical protein
VQLQHCFSVASAALPPHTHPPTCSATFSACSNFSAAVIGVEATPPPPPLSLVLDTGAADATAPPPEAAAEALEALEAAAGPGARRYRMLRASRAAWQVAIP